MGILSKGFENADRSTINKYKRKLATYIDETGHFNCRRRQWYFRQSGMNRHLREFLYYMVNYGPVMELKRPSGITELPYTLYGPTAKIYRISSRKLESFVVA